MGKVQVGKPVSPWQRVECPACGWRGRLSAAVSKPGDATRCPKCRAVVFVAGKR